MNNLNLNRCYDESIYDMYNACAEPCISPVLVIRYLWLALYTCEAALAAERALRQTCDVTLQAFACGVVCLYIN